MFATTSVASSQELFIREYGTRLPIEDASVTSKTSGQLALSNENGLAYVENSDSSDVFVISHPAYNEISISADQIGNDQVKIYLEAKIFQFEEVVVAATKWEQGSNLLTQEVLKVTPKDIAFNNPQTSADLLSSTGKVFVQKSQLGGGSPMIRGFSASSLLLVLDGVRLNNAIYRSGNLQNVIVIDPNLLSSSEVVFGPSSALYGSDALGGTMTFNTIKPNFIDEDSPEVSGKMMLRYSSANHERTSHAQFQFASKRFTNVLGFSYSGFSDLRTGSQRATDHPDFGKRLEYIDRVEGEDQIIQNNNVNVQKYSGYHQYNLMNKASLRLSKKSDLSYTLYYSTSSDVPRYDRLTQRTDEGALKNAEWYYGPQEFAMHALTFSNYSENALYNGVKLTVSYQDVEESRHNRKYQNASINHRNEQVDVVTANLDLDKKIGAKTELFYGGEFLWNDVTSTASVENIETGESDYLDTRYPDGGSQYQSWAAYASLNHKATDWLSLTSGLRYTDIVLDAQFDNISYSLPFDDIHQSNGAWSGTLGTVVTINKYLRWKVLFSSGFRVPNLDDAGKVFDSGDVVVVPNEDLEPEYTLNYETGIDWKVRDAFQIEGVIYYTQLKSAMVRRPYSYNGESTIIYEGEEFPMAALVNVGEAYIWGYSLGAKVFVSEHLGVKANVSNSFGEDLVEHEPLRHVTPLFGNVSVIYQRLKFKSELFMNFQGSVPFDKLAPSEQSKAYLYSSNGALAWYTVNLRSSYQFNKKWSMTAALENILDQHYRSYSSGISAAGFNARVSASVLF
ncbi:MAG: TonB-dependent receptor [Reichenbachiella sp.]